MKTNYSFLILAIFLLFSMSCETTISDKIAEEKETVTLTKKKLVLAIDGGGIKGIIPATIIKALEDSLGKQMYEVFDVIGGTSTGGIISLGLTTPNGAGPNLPPRTASQVLDFYKKDCSKIFVANTGLNSGPKYFADYNGAGVEAFLRTNFGGNTLKSSAMNDPVNKRVQQVFTTSYLINGEGGKVVGRQPEMGRDFGPYLFNWHDATIDPYDNYYIWEAARATSAAPTYFPVAHVGGGMGPRSGAAQKWALDGGVMSNDPAMFAASEALRTKVANTMNDLVVISLGCGIDPFNGGINVIIGGKAGPTNRFGFWGDSWAAPSVVGNRWYNLNDDIIAIPALLQVESYANQFVPVSQLQRFAEANTGFEYYRMQPTYKTSLAMDKCNLVPALIADADAYLKSTEGIKLLNEILKVIRDNQ